MRSVGAGSAEPPHEVVPLEMVDAEKLAQLLDRVGADALPAGGGQK